MRITRGWHACSLCDRDAPYPIIETWKGRSVDLGSAEIEVTGPDGIRYATPQLIFHYVVRHEYQPPSGFVEAVLHGEFAEETYFQILDFQRVEPELAGALKLGLTRRLGLAGELADRIDLRIAIATIVRSWSTNPNREARALYVARRLIEVPWDGTVAGGLAILDSFCESHQLAFDEYWASGREVGSRPTVGQTDGAGTVTSALVRRRNARAGPRATAP